MYCMKHVELLYDEGERDFHVIIEYNYDVFISCHVVRNNLLIISFQVEMLI